MALTTLRLSNRVPVDWQSSGLHPEQSELLFGGVSSKGTWLI
jgi:hypothetical protein